MGVVLMSISGCTEEQANSYFAKYSEILQVADDGTSFIMIDGLASVISGTEVFKESELNMLLHMKEEEKLARDVYAALYEKWGSQIFLRISEAEENHMNAIIFLLQKYGEGYTQVTEKGKFSNTGFQDLYDKLVKQGSVSYEEAYKTGALIEELDIKDLNEFISELTSETILFVFENLNKGSRNHLRAFNRQIVRMGLTYTPVYISQVEYDQIVSSSHESGNQGQMSGNGRFGRRYGQR